MIKLIADLHSHTNASSHGLSTCKEMLDWAMDETDLWGLAITEHVYGAQDAPSPAFFHILMQQPGILYSKNNDGRAFFFLKGAEANILDTQGSLDLHRRYLHNLDWVIASMHSSVITPMDYEECTELWIRIAQNPYVDMIGHAEQDNYPCDYDSICKAFAQNNKVVELNASSRLNRPGSDDNMLCLAKACKKHSVKVAVNSDSHSCYQLCNWGHLLDMLKEIEFPRELVVNSDVKILAEELKLHSRQAYENVLQVYEINKAVYKLND